VANWKRRLGHELSHVRERCDPMLRPRIRDGSGEGGSSHRLAHVLLPASPLRPRPPLRRIGRSRSGRFDPGDARTGDPRWPMRAAPQPPLALPNRWCSPRTRPRRPAAPFWDRPSPPIVDPARGICEPRVGLQRIPCHYPQGSLTVSIGAAGRCHPWINDTAGRTEIPAPPPVPCLGKAFLVVTGWSTRT
jgi:hypothetical protein